MNEKGDRITFVDIPLVMSEGEAVPPSQLILRYDTKKKQYFASFVCSMGICDVKLEKTTGGGK